MLIQLLYFGSRNMSLNVVKLVKLAESLSEWNRRREKGHMSLTKRSIFRDRAIQRYRQRRDQDVLPRLVAPPAFALLWILLSLCLLTGFLAWSTRLPTYASVSGVIVQDEQSGQNQALLFATADQGPTIQPGQPVQLQIGSSGPQLHLVVTSLVSQVLNPDQIRTRFDLNGALGLAIEQPAVVVVVALGQGPEFQGYLGSLVSANVQIGSRSAFSLLPFLGPLIGR